MARIISSALHDVLSLIEIAYRVIVYKHLVKILHFGTRPNVKFSLDAGIMEIDLEWLVFPLDALASLRFNRFFFAMSTS